MNFLRRALISPPFQKKSIENDKPRVPIVFLNWGLLCNNSIGAWRHLLSLFSLDEMIGNLSENWHTEYSQKKYVAVEDLKLHKIDQVNFFLQCAFFPKIIKNQKFWNRKLIQFKTKLAESRRKLSEKSRFPAFHRKKSRGDFRLRYSTLWLYFPQTMRKFFTKFCTNRSVIYKMPSSSTQSRAREDFLDSARALKITLKKTRKKKYLCFALISIHL